MTTDMVEIRIADLLTGWHLHPRDSAGTLVMSRFDAERMARQLRRRFVPDKPEVIKIEILPGTRLEHAVWQAINTANTNQQPVQIQFNDKTIIAQPGDEIATLVDRYLGKESTP